LVRPHHFCNRDANQGKYKQSRVVRQIEDLFKGIESLLHVMNAEK